MDKIITIYSPGGGTGKSEIAASLAYILAGKGKKVWLIDANLFAPSQDILYHIKYDNCNTFSEFLLNETLSQIPVCDISHIVKSHNNGRLYLTPCVRNDMEMRFRLENVLIDDENICEKIPGAIHQGLGEDVDYLIVDTHPGFERINQVWLGITNYLLIISRINDIDLENLKMLLGERTIRDIPKKLILFNNVCINNERNAFKTMKNHEMNAKFIRLIRNPSDTTGADTSNNGLVEIFQHAIPFSAGLASFPSSKGLYIQNHKLSNFSLVIQSLSEKIIRDV